MAAFRFRLEKVLELRRSRELDQAIRLAAARNAADEAEEVRAALEAVHETGVRHLARVHGLGGSAGQLQNIAHMLGLLRDHIHEANVACRAAQGHVELQLENLTEAVRERQVLADLRDRQRLAWDAGQASRERKLMDQIALDRHVRGRSNDTTEAAS